MHLEQRDRLLTEPAPPAEPMLLSRQITEDGRDEPRSCPAPGEPGRGTGPLLDRVEPAHLFVILAFFVAVLLSAGPISDIDSFWHVVLGREILDKHTVFGIGNDWSLFPGGRSWVTSQWLSEAGMAALVNAFGWGGLVAARVACTVALLLELAWLTVPGRPARVGAYVYAATVITLSGVLQERPQLVSFLFLAWLAHHAARMMRGRRGPAYWLTGLLVLVWANLHGMWVMAPLAFALVTAGRLLDGHPRRDEVTRRAAALTLLTAVTGCLTPLGPRGLVLPLVFQRSTAYIVEWAPTTLWSAHAVGLVLLMAGVGYSWARSTSRVARSELLWVAVWVAFALPATRNVAVSVILLAPVVADRLATDFTKRATTRPLERRLLAALAVTFVAVGAVWSVTMWLSVRPLSDTHPLRIARYLAAAPGEKRVFDSYNSSGVLLAFGGPDIKLAIDGRADRYGNDYIGRSIKAEALGAGWRKTFFSVDSNYAVLPRHSALAHELRDHEGWARLLVDGRWVLLGRPA